MAVDGRKFNESLSQGSEDYYDFPCSPCTKEGRNVPGTSHCVDCGENLCASCLKDHNKFAVMRGHQILNKAQDRSDGRCQLPNQKCTKHGGKLIDVYCPGHDTVGCSTCIAVDHSSCQGIIFVPDVAKGKSDATAMELKDLEAKMEVLYTRLVSLKQRKDGDLEYLQQDKDRIKAEMQTLRKKINDHLNTLEDNLIRELDAKYDVLKRQNIDVDIEGINCFLEELKRNQLLLQRGGNDSELFVLLKSGNINLRKCSTYADEIELSTKTRRLELRVDRRLQNIIVDIECIGRIAEKTVEISASFQGKYNIRVNDDKECEQVNGICETSDGAIIITDHSNRRVKKLDCKYKVTAHVDLPGSPCSVCQVDETRIAVTMMELKKVQLVSYNEPMKLLSSFSVGDHCRGVLHHNGLLYVCCGGSKIIPGEGPGHLEIYSTKGVLLRSIYEAMETPTRAEISSDGKVIYVYDAYSGLVLIDNNGTIPSHHKYKQLKLSGGMCKLNDDLLCLGGHESNNIVAVTADGKFHQELLTRKDGIKNPLSLCYDEKKSRLTVAMYKEDDLKVFTLNM
ncbi:uncharacterized protein LOC123551847 [Mercenaria mercenaria]|uniref:uncharacterized protein LOC123551847 n=1 Tax=Mercenaria mercenaria TaxID=6596 RepID=UPI00234F6D29|nr:uncharacterized protein LOC123551847 [Mercenaria mercenaria]